MMQDQTLKMLQQLDLLEQLLLEGLRFPFTGNRLVNEQETIDVLDELRDQIPKDIEIAAKIIKKGDHHITEAKRQSDEIISLAKKKRDQCLDTFAIKKEAERQIAQIQNSAEVKREQILQDSREKARLAERNIQAKIATLDQKYNKKLQILEQEFIDKRKQLEKEHMILDERFKRQHELNSQKAIEVLNEYRQESIRLKQANQKETEVTTENLKNYTLKIQAQCESLISQANSESSQIKEGANSYADKCLKDLEKKLIEMSKIVVSGRNEIARRQQRDSNSNRSNNT